MAESSPALSSWQTSALGRAVVVAEARLLAECCDDVFGLELLQVGAWGRERELVRSSRVRRQTVITSHPVGAQMPDIVASAAVLPICSGSIDAVLLPHSLEVEPDPGAVLREAERVLVGEGQLIVLGISALESVGPPGRGNAQRLSAGNPSPAVRAATARLAGAVGIRDFPGATLPARPARGAQG